MRLTDSDQRQKIHLCLNGEKRSGYAEPRLLLSDFLRHELGPPAPMSAVSTGCAAPVLCNWTEQRYAPVCCWPYRPTGVGWTPWKDWRRQTVLQAPCNRRSNSTLEEFLRHHPRPSETEVRTLLSGHLCRCTGYSTIVQATLSAAGQLASEPARV